MDNSAEQQNKSCELVPLQDLRNLIEIGFPIIPLRQDSKTPNVHSTNDIYNNPGYWSEDRLRNSHHLFHNVATLFGKSHIKDKDGRDVFLNELDIDSDHVFTRLARIIHNGKDVYLIDELCRSTYVVKTKKKFGYRIYWFSYKQNKAIRTRDTKLGHEFEIKTDNSGGHSTLPPSVHRKDQNFRYQNIGQNKIDINDDLYDGLLDLLSDLLITRSSGNHKSEAKFTYETLYEIGSTDCSNIASVISNAYRNGSRNDIIYDLSSFLIHQTLKLKSAKEIIEYLCTLTDDEEVSNRLQVVQNTYEKAINGEPITGPNSLSETLERIIGTDAAKQITKDITEILNKNRDPIFSQLNQSIRNELSGHIFETICYTPLTLVVARAVKKQILTFKTPRYSHRDEAENNNRLQVLRHGEVIINASPVKIIRYENPLNNQIKYQIDFMSSVGQLFTIPPSTVEDITKELRMRGVVYKQRFAEEALNAIINGAQRQNKVSVVRQIDTPGFYYLDSKVVASEISGYSKELSSEDIKKCAEFLNELVARSKHPEIMVTELKWAMLSPFSYIFKQLSQEGKERWMPWLYLDGHTQTSKTTDGTIALAIYRKQKSKVGLGSVDNIRRLAEAISRSTFPTLIDEVRLNPRIQADLIEAIKHSVQGETARTRLSLASKPIHIPALSACIMTSNHSLPADLALRRRFLNFHYPKEDKPTKEEIKEFESFLKPGWNILGILGDFTINYLLQYQEIIINDENDWRDIAKIVLVEFHKVAGLTDWIDMISDGNQFEDAEVEEEEIIRGFFRKKINDTFSRTYRTLVSYEDQKTESSHTKNKTIESRLSHYLRYPRRNKSSIYNQGAY